MDIKFATQSDIQELVDMLALAFGEEDRDCAQSEMQLIFEEKSNILGTLIALKGGKIVGSVCITEEWMSYDMYAFSWVATHPKYQRQGIASALLAHATNYISLKELKGKKGTVILYTSDSHKLYEKNGFSKAGSGHTPSGNFFTKILN